MSAKKLSKGFAFHVTVLDHQVIAGREKCVQVIEDCSYIVMGIFNYEPRMRF